MYEHQSVLYNIIALDCRLVKKKSKIRIDVRLNWSENWRRFQFHLRNNKSALEIIFYIKQFVIAILFWSTNIHRSPVCLLNNSFSCTDTTLILVAIYLSLKTRWIFAVFFFKNISTDHSNFVFWEIVGINSSNGTWPLNTHVCCKSYASKLCSIFSLLDYIEHFFNLRFKSGQSFARNARLHTIAVVIFLFELITTIV